MSALAMILTAAMVAPGNGPEMESGKIAQNEQGFDLRGIWEGSLRMRRADGTYYTVPGSYQDGKLTIVELDGPEVVKVVFIDEGKGKFRYRAVKEGEEGLGIYKWNQEQLVLCLGEKKRPSSFRDEDGFILILHRVKPCK
jgi:hypothetical protein